METATKSLKIKNKIHDNKTQLRYKITPKFEINTKIRLTSRGTREKQRNCEF